MSQHIEVEQVVTSGGYSISANGVAHVTFKSKYGELVNTVNMLQLLNNDIDVTAFVPGEKPSKVARFMRIKNISVDGDGEQTVKLQGISEFVDVEELSKLPFKNAEIPEFKVQFASDIEINDSDEEEDEDDWDDEDWEEE